MESLISRKIFNITLGELVRNLEKPRIVNIVATGRFPQEIDIERAYRCLNCEEKIYEPEVYPALLVKVGQKKHHITIYANGKFIICGVKSKKELDFAYAEIVRKLKECSLI
jgi:TATA-box binding protein (TBP) (component of TFIID and TFIIIB)